MFITNNVANKQTNKHSAIENNTSLAFSLGRGDKHAVRNRQMWIGLSTHRYSHYSSGAQFHIFLFLFMPNSTDNSAMLTLKVTRNLAIANRSRVSCAHKVTGVSRSLKWPRKVTQGHRNSEMSRFSRAQMISYYRSVETMVQFCIVSHI